MADAWIEEYTGSDEQVKRLQAEAMEELLADLAKAEAAQDPVGIERRMFGSALAAARLKRRLSQSELAARLGSGQAYVSRLENGRGNPGLTILLKIAKALDVNLVVE